MSTVDSKCEFSRSNPDFQKRIVNVEELLMVTLYMISLCHEGVAGEQVSSARFSTLVLSLASSIRLYQSEEQESLGHLQLRAKVLSKKNSSVY